MALYLKSGAGAAEFAQSTAYVSGNKIVPKISDAGSNYLVARRWVWECTTGGTSAAAEPTWPASVTQDVTTVTSGTATFTARKPGFSSGSTADWAFAAIFFEYLVGASSSGEEVYVSSNHAESYGAAVTTGPTADGKIVCVDDAAAPPTALATGAVVATNGEFGMSAIGNGAAHVYGITFRAGVGATGTRSIVLSAKRFERCNFELATTGAATISASSAQSELVKCGFKFGGVSQTIQGHRLFECSLLAGGTSPTALFAITSVPMHVLGLDISNANAAVNLLSAAPLGPMTISGIKLPASWSGIIINPGSLLNNAEVNIFSASNSATPLVQRSVQLRGTVVEETTIVKTDGATIQGTPISSKMVSVATAAFPAYALNGLPIAKYNAAVGAPITVTVDILRDSLTNLTNKDIALEVSYLSDSGAPMMAIASSADDFVATATDCAASSATWTTTGLTNPNEQKLSVTFTPQMAGMVIGRVKLCKASATVYVDPVLQIS